MTIPSRVTQRTDPKCPLRQTWHVLRDQESLVAGEAGERITDDALRLHLVPALGSRAVAAIRRNDLQVLFKSLSEQLGPGRVRNVHDVLVRLMTAAVEDKVIASSPCRRITLPPVPDEEVPSPSVAQVEAVARAMPPYIRAAIVILAGSGLRIGELLGLKVSDVDFKAGTIRVERQRLQSGKIGPPKTAKSRRTVPVGEVVTDALLTHLPARPSKEWLFTMEEGEPLDYRRRRTEWNCARRTLQATPNAPPAARSTPSTCLGYTVALNQIDGAAWPSRLQREE